MARPRPELVRAVGAGWADALACPVRIIARAQHSKCRPEMTIWAHHARAWFKRGGTMAGIDYALIAFAISAMVAFGALGWLRPNIRAWHWIDVVYYPLAGAGVVLLFLSNDLNRTASALEARLSGLENSWEQLPNPMPRIDIEAPATEALALRAERFKRDLVHGETCEVVSTPYCSAVVQRAEIVEELFSNYSVPTSADRISLAAAELDLCERGYRLVDRLDEADFLAGGAFGATKRALAALASGEDDAAVHETLRQEIISGRARLVDSVSDDRGMVVRYAEAQGIHAMDLYFRLSSCAALPEDQRRNVESFQRWRAEADTRETTRAETQRQIAVARETNAKTPVQKVGSSLRDSIWPFVLLLALALKFGKGLTAVSKLKKLGDADDQPKADEPSKD